MHVQGFAGGPGYLNGCREQHHSREKATCAGCARQPCEGCVHGREMLEVRQDGNIGANLELLQKHSSEGLWPQEHC